MDTNNVLVGSLSAVVTELLKLIPWLNQNSITKAATSLVVCFVGTFLFTPHNPGDYATVITSSLVAYLAIVQPTGKFAGVKTQI